MIAIHAFEWPLDIAISSRVNFHLTIMTSAWYCSHYVHVNSGRRYVCGGGSRPGRPVFGIVRPVASADPLVVVTVLDGPSRPSSRTTADYVRTDDERYGISADRRFSIDGGLI